jgi:hypothetical protein
MGYHDAAEDHGGMLRLKDIEHNFGKNVARMVEGLSDSLTEDPGNKQSWQTRKESYIERLRDPRPRAVDAFAVTIPYANSARRFRGDYSLRVLWNRHAFHPCRKLTTPLLRWSRKGSTVWRGDTKISTITTNWRGAMN